MRVRRISLALTYPMNLAVARAATVPAGLDGATV